jgi:xylulokinase
VIPKTLIGIDIGTTAVKAVMTDLSGRRLTDYAARYPTSRPAPGWVEQDPADWLAHVEAALARFAAVPGQVQGIGITSQVNTHIFCDAGLAPLAPAIVWQDGRAAAQAAALDGMISVADKVAALGAPIPIDASHALSRMAWMAAERPDIWTRTNRVMAPKDWVIARLTRAAGADPIASVGLVGPDMQYAGAVLDLMPGAATRLPPLSDPLAGAGVISGGLFQGVPVVRGTMDAWAAMFGVGVARDGQAMNLSGTSEVLGLISAIRNPVPGVITFPAWRGITLHAGPTQAGGASLDWLGRIMGQSTADLAALAREGTIRADSPLFLPHLQGERAPLWDMAARGTFAGLSGATGPVEMVLSVMEGVAFSARLAMEALEQAGGLRAEVIRAGGGGTASDNWCQIRANVFGRPLLRMAAQDAGAVGALVMAGAGLGLMPDLAVAAERLVPQDRKFTPDPMAAALADQRFAIWRALYEQVRPIHAQLGAVG